VKTLIIAPAWVGDMVMAHTLVQRLATLDQDLRLHVAAPKATAPLATRMREVDKVTILDFDHGELGFTRRWRLGRDFRGQHFEQAYVLPNSWKSALLPFFAKVPRRVGWRGEARYGLLNNLRRLDKEKYPLMIERYMALADSTGVLPAKPYPLPRLQVDADNAARCLDDLGLSRERVTVICPGAEFGVAKKWPAKHYAEVAHALLAAGRQVWLIGSPKDAADCAAIAASATGVRDLSGRTSLLDALDLLSFAEQVICNDSGLMHMACALNIPTVGIFGSTSAEFTPPLGDQAVVVGRQLSCRPCFQRVCPLGHTACLQKLAPSQVLEQLGI
jgi:heptosyltransferase-2